MPLYGRFSGYRSVKIALAEPFSREIRASFRFWVYTFGTGFGFRFRFWVYILGFEFVFCVSVSVHLG